MKCCNAITPSPQPPQFKLDPRLARLLGIHTQTRSCIIQALWQYIKTNKLQDSHDKEYINCDKYFQQVPESLRVINHIAVAWILISVVAGNVQHGMRDFFLGSTLQVNQKCRYNFKIKVQSVRKSVRSVQSDNQDCCYLWMYVYEQHI